MDFLSIPVNWTVQSAEEKEAGWGVVLRNWKTQSRKLWTSSVNLVILPIRKPPRLWKMTWKTCI